MDELVSYFDSTWMNGAVQASPMELLQLQRATYQQQCSRVAFKAKKSEIIGVFKREEVSTKVKMQVMEAGAQQAPRRRWVKQKERQIQNLLARFNSEAMSYNMNDYLEAIKYNTGLRDFICM